MSHLQSMDDISAGKLANCICAYEFEDREPMEQLSDNEDFLLEQYRKYFERSQGNGKYREDTEEV